jgi:alpha-beta hydrolase superfamily lysophospholipase
MPEPVITDDGLRLVRVAWPAQRVSQPGRGTVLIVHGLGEHCERYIRLASDLSAAGWAVHGYDQRGHGMSEGARGAIASHSSLLDDLALVIDALQFERTARPLVLLGHSMGGTVAARLVSDGPAFVDALVLSSPALDPGLGLMRTLQLAAGARLMPDTPVRNGLQPGCISRDPSIVRAYIDDTRVHDRITPRLARFIVDAGREVIERAARWHTPTLLMWAGADRCVAPRGSAAFAAAAPAGVVHWRRVDGLAHEIFNEPERDLVVGALIDWLSRRAR